MTGPYREGGAGLACPVCAVAMLAEGTWKLTCVKGCGDWWHKHGLERSIDWRVVESAEPYRLFGASATVLPCPDCATAMTTSLRAKILFSHCDGHGLWLARRDRAAFDALGGWVKVLAVRGVANRP